MNLTDAELEQLKTCKSTEEWNNICYQIKKTRGGSYPPDWHSKVLATGLMRQVLGQGADTIKSYAFSNQNKNMTALIVNIQINILKEVDTTSQVMALQNAFLCFNYDTLELFVKAKVENVNLCCISGFNILNPVTSDKELAAKSRGILIQSPFVDNEEGLRIATYLSDQRHRIDFYTIFSELRGLGASFTGDSFYQFNIKIEVEEAANENVFKTSLYEI